MTQGEEMTRGETIQMVRKAGFPDGIAEFIGLEAFEELIKLSAEHERKACAEHYLGIMRNAVQSAVEAEREACAEIADRLPRIYRETKEAHERLSMEPFKPSNFGFDFAVLQQAEKITHSIRARNQT